MGAELIGGKEFFSKLTGVEEKIAGSDLVISGEGRLDNQSFCGKVVDGIVTLAGKHKKPVALFCGLSEIS
ncbi:MAG: glycerate kinase, partial [Erysipelotrichia bacterium]|nr:glycerate kinase [Erysipelotrichia bacterium]